MNDIELQNLKAVCQKYKNVCVDIGILVDIIKAFSNADGDKVFFPETIVSLQKGFYGRLYTANLWVSRLMVPDHIGVTDEDIRSITDIWGVDINQFSPPMPLALAQADKLERILNLKAFW